MKRCPWSEQNGELVTKYHDEEWGLPVHDDVKHFEFLVLEINQAGLSWKTVLMKRDNYKKAYDNFNPAVVAEYDDEKITRLLNNEGIIRNTGRLKLPFKMLSDSWRFKWNSAVLTVISGVS